MKRQEDQLLMVYIEELKALRNEQGWRGKEQSTIIHRILLIASGVLAASISIQESLLQKIAIIILIFPLFVIPYVFGYLAHMLVIYKIGNYIQNELRPKIEILLDKNNLLYWDEFHVKTTLFQTPKNIITLIIGSLEHLVLLLPNFVVIIVFELFPTEIKGILKLIYNLDIFFGFLILLSIIYVYFLFGKILPQRRKSSQIK